jgi:pSer/pThr/pTyr-binding forkhead associated (FHA) protein
MSSLLLSALGVVCPSCDQLNPPRAQQCSACGKPASSGPAAPKATAPASSAPKLTPAAAKPAARPEVVPPGMKPSSRPPVVTSFASSPGGAGPPVIAPSIAPSAPARPAAGVAKPTAAPSKFGVLLISGPSKGQRLRLPAAPCPVGRSKGTLLFQDDPYVSAHHATFVVKESGLFIKDEGSPSGIFVTISAPENLSANSFFSVGPRLFRYGGPVVQPAAPPLPGRLVYGAPVPQGQILYSVEEILIGGRTGKAIVSPGPLITVGQSNCDFAIADTALAGRHCELSPSPKGAQLRDLSGGLGTFVRVGSGAERPLRVGDRVRIGQQVLQIETAA